MASSDLPRPVSPNNQRRLFDTPLGNHGTIRTCLGAFAEDLTAELFNGTRLVTDSRCAYCPDVIAFVGRRYKRRVSLECKTAGKSNQTFVYAGRLKKDRDYAEQNRLLYVIWHHSTDTKSAATEEELRALFLVSIKNVYLVPFDSIDSICRRLREEKLNSNYGHKGTDADKCYGSGFRIPIKSLADYPHVKIAWKIEHLDTLRP